MTKISKEQKERIINELCRRLDYCEEISIEASNFLCKARPNYAEAAICLEKQAAELIKSGHDCRLLAE